MAYSTTEDISELLKQTTLKDNIEVIGSELGRGSYGRVFRVLYGGLIYAAKEIHPILYEEVGLEAKEAIRRSFLRECYYCSTLNHSNIVQFIGIYYPPHMPLHLPIMVMELMDSRLTSFIRHKSPNLDSKVKNSILLDVARGLSYLHNRHPPVIHRDLSPNNIMLTSQPVAKIGDLGVAKAIRADSRRTKGKLTNAPGTTDFMPPEALQDDAVYDTSLDVFSFGGIILYVITEEWPTPKASTKFNSVTRSTTGFNEVERRKHYLDKIIGNVTLRLLVERCLDNDPNMRPTMPSVMKTLKFNDNDSEVHKANSYKATVQIFANGTKTLPSPCGYQNIQQVGKRRFTVSSDIPPAFPPRLTDCDITDGNTSARCNVNNDKAVVQIFSYGTKTLPLLCSSQNVQQGGKRSYSVSSKIPPAIPPRVPHRIPLSTLQSGRCHIKWTRCADLPYKMHSISVVADMENNKIYVCPNNSLKLNQCPYRVFCYDLTSHQWTELPKLRRYRCVLVMCNRQLNVIGGYNSQSHELTKKVSTYCEIMNSWVSIYPDLFTARLKPGAIAYQDHMIVAGGYLNDNHIADDIEVLNCLQQPYVWKRSVVRLPAQMWAINFAICSDYLYIVGYYNATHTRPNAFGIPANALINSSKLYTNTPYWTTLPEAPYFRAGLASTHLLLMTAGGSNKSSQLTSGVFWFDRFNNKWRNIGCLTSPRAGVAICTINNTIMVLGGYSRGGSIEASEESSLTTVEMGEVEI